MPSQHQSERPTIGVLAGWQFYRTATNLSYLAPVFRGISRAAQDLGCNLLLGCGIGPSASPSDPLRPAWPVQSAQADFVPIGPWNTDGMIVANPLHDMARSRWVQELIAQGHPVLFVGLGEEGPTIAADNRGGILEAMGHLVEHGHRQVAFIAGTVDDMNGDSGERLRAYESAQELYNLDKNPKLVVHGRHVYDGGYAAMREILAGGAPFTAVLASNDESALGAMQALKEAGCRVPGDVAVIGFDHRLEGAAHLPQLSSVHVPLLNMGYNALERIVAHITSGSELERIVKVETRLIARDSCGCTTLKDLPGLFEPKRESELSAVLSERILIQAHSLTDEQCRSFCAQLVDTFSAALLHGQRLQFQQTLSEILQHTSAVDDDAHIWQEALSVLGEQPWGLEFAAPLAELLNESRLTVSAAMQRQHRQYVLDERWNSSRLSLLTARLLIALEEPQIYNILARHLPDLNIHTARLVLFEPAENDPCAWSISRDALLVDPPPVRFPSREFPPTGMFAGGQPFTLTLIPLVDPSGQLGFMAFGIEQFDLYGAIAQQVSGALNTARLYRQATEGRRLAEETNRMKSRFLSTISHELRTPLNLIVGLSGMVLQASNEGGTPLPEPTHMDVERISMYAQHLGGLIGDVIDLATSDAGQLRLNNEFVDLGQALRIVAESGHQLAAEKGLAWETVLPEAGPWVWADQTRLRQVALNLINNAIKFTEHGNVSLRLETGADSVRVLVSDTGLGISSDEQQAIFDEFRQSERSVALGYGGLGLGLSISKRIVEMHGGTIGVHSTGVKGAGSTFYFTLPTVQPPADRTRRLTSQPKKEPTVMVLTNHPGSSERLCEQLSQRGFEVKITLVDSQFDWQSSFFESLPDTVLLDVGIASNLGWDALKAIKGSQTARDIPVLFYKSSHDDGTVMELDYLTKPIELAELTRALDHQWLMANVDRPGRAILVVDDDPQTLDMHARIVQSHLSSNHVFTAHNGHEALGILERETIDLVLLDLQMPEMDGFGVLEKMRENERMHKIPAIVVTGKVLNETDMARLNRGVAAVLEKGLFSLDETAARISAALERKSRLSAEAKRLVRKAMAFIHEHFADPISRREMAQHVSISEDHLTFCFRQELGTTPIEYLHRYRIHQAKRLLKDNERTVTEIALDVGFSDSGYFSRIFRREMGMSPEAFRRS